MYLTGSNFKKFEFVKFASRVKAVCKFKISPWSVQFLCKAMVLSVNFSLICFTDPSKFKIILYIPIFLSFVLRSRLTFAFKTKCKAPWIHSSRLSKFLHQRSFSTQYFIVCILKPLKNWLLFLFPLSCCYSFLTIVKSRRDRPTTDGRREQLEFHRNVIDGQSIAFLGILLAPKVFYCYTTQVMA